MPSVRDGYPWAIERDYLAFLRTRVRAVHATLARAVQDAIDVRHIVADDELTASIANTLVQAVDRAAGGVAAVGPNPVTISRFALRLDRWANQLLQLQAPGARSSTRDLWIERSWLQQNLDLIQSLDRRLIGDMRTALLEAVGAEVGDLQAILETSGRPITESPAHRLDAKSRPNGRIVMTGPKPRILKTPLDVAEGRTTTVAIDQVGTGNKDFSKRVQQNAGITMYIWRTQRDLKVRAAHRLREGKTFRWSAPPPGGHPGEDYNCRCWPEPVQAVRRARRARGRFRL